VEAGRKKGGTGQQRENGEQANDKEIRGGLARQTKSNSEIGNFDRVTNVCHTYAWEKKAPYLFGLAIKTVDQRKKKLLIGPGHRAEYHLPSSVERQTARLIQKIQSSGGIIHG